MKNSNSTKHISIDCRWLNTSGIGRCIQSYLHILLGFNNHFFYLLGNKNEINKYLNNKNIKYKKNNKIKIIEFEYKMYSVQEQLMFLIKIPNVVGIHISTNFNVPLINNKKLIVFIYDMYHFSSFYENYIRKLYVKLFFIKIAKKSILNFTISNFSKKEILNNTNINQKTLKYYYLGSNRNLINNNSNLSKPNFLKKKYILYVGNLKPHKNLSLIFNAFLNLPKEYSNYYLFIVGKMKGFHGGDKNLLSKIHNNKNDKIKIFEDINDDKLSQFYKNAKLYISASLYEGFSLPPLEAMTYKCPILISDIDVHKEIYKKYANYFKSNNQKDLTKNILKILKNYHLYKSNAVKFSVYSNKFKWSDFSTNVISDIKNTI